MSEEHRDDQRRLESWGIGGIYPRDIVIVQSGALFFAESPSLPRQRMAGTTACAALRGLLGDVSGSQQHWPDPEPLILTGTQMIAVTEQHDLYYARRVTETPFSRRVYAPEVSGRSPLEALVLLLRRIQELV